jgi:sensor histidine kinase YesM
MVGPINALMKNTELVGSKLLPHTGEENFDNLVDHVNEMFMRIEDRERALYESEARIKEADLEKERTLVSLLKKQISAHFTVNTLNVVRALINKGEKATAARICDELSTLLRYANAGDEYISLLEEFYVLEQYIGIMQARYPGRIEADFEEDDAFADIVIPRMLIQPIIENAVVHGLSGKSGKVKISADAGTDLTITVSDDGIGMNEATLQALRAGIESDEGVESPELKHMALKNIERRIKMVCGSEYGLKIESKRDEGTRVMVRLPLITGLYDKE